MILDESVLRRQIGAPQVMANQLRHLAERSADPTIDIRVLPFRAGPPASTVGAFTVFELPDPFPEVAYIESMAGSLYIEAPDTKSFAHADDGHTSLALGRDDSTELVLAMADEWG